MASSLTRTSRQENSALLLGGLGFLVGAAFGLILLRPHSAIFGQGSVGELGAFVALFGGGLGFLIGMLTGRQQHPWLARLSRFRRGVDIAGLAIVHGLFAFFAATAAYAVFAGALRTLQLDR